MANFPNLSLDEVVPGAVPRVDKDRLLVWFNQEVLEDVRKGLGLEDMKKGTCLLLMMKETRIKIGEKARKNTSSGARDAEIEHGNEQMKKFKATLQVISFINVDNSSIIDTTPIIDKIRKFEELLTSGQAILVDEVGNPLKKVEFSGDYDSEDEVASVDNDMARSMVSERHGYAVTYVNGYDVTNSKSINRALISAFEISIPGVVSRQQEEGGKGMNSP
ncbi:hypothetical protein Tco_0163322, partial [Tanacetum coccineum]